MLVRRASVIACALALTASGVALSASGPPSGQTNRDDVYAAGPTVQQTVASSAATALAGPGVTVTNVTQEGDPSQLGLVSNGGVTLGFDSGVILSTGHAVDFAGTPDQTASTNFGNPGDPLLDSLVPGSSTHDAAGLNFTFVPTTSQVQLQFVFASEEYDAYVGTAFNDLAALYVNGSNCAQLPGGGAAIDVNDINRQTNPTYYRPNTGVGSLNLPTRANGLTTTLTCIASVTPGQPNTLDALIADNGDGVLDSWMVLQASSLKALPPGNESPPAIVGRPLQGSALAEAHGTWSNGPTAFGYQWEDCDSAGNACAPIAGATNPTYTVMGTDVGHTIRVLETASNAAGPGIPATSDATAIVTPVTGTGQKTLVTEPVALTTTQTHGKKSGESLSIPAGTVGETDRATLTGTNVAHATGSVSYALYSKASCVASSAVFHSAARTVAGPAAPASAPVTDVLVAGRYYWRATYSGDQSNAPAMSRCGAEVLTVTAPAQFAPIGAAGPTAVMLKVGCAIIPCTLNIRLTATQKVEIPATGARATKKRPKRKFRTETVTIASDAVHIVRTGNVAVDAPLTPQGKKYLAKHRRHLKLKLTISETIKGVKLITQRTISIGIAKVPSSGGPGSGEHPKA
jgi:hypothetical protein